MYLLVYITRNGILVIYETTQMYRQAEEEV